MKIGFIGVGVMGNGMVKNLLQQGYEVNAYTRTRAKALEALDAGAVWRENVADCVRDADAVISIVGFPPDVEEVYFGDKGILANARPGTLVIDMTTTSPRLAQRIYTEAAAKGLWALDAPVSGGDTGARAGTLSIMVGGDREVFERAVPIFERPWAAAFADMGPAGSGQHTKMANQIAIAGTLQRAGVCEPSPTLAPWGWMWMKSSPPSAAWPAPGSFQQRPQEPIYFAPGFFIKHFIKDMTTDRPGRPGRARPHAGAGKGAGPCSARWAQGYGDENLQALIRAYR